jgi:hypothetical protein
MPTAWKKRIDPRVAAVLAAHPDLELRPRRIQHRASEGHAAEELVAETGELDLLVVGLPQRASEDRDRGVAELRRRPRHGGTPTSVSVVPTVRVRGRPRTAAAGSAHSLRP